MTEKEIIPWGEAISGGLMIDRFSREEKEVPPESDNPTDKNGADERGGREGGKERCLEREENGTEFGELLSSLYEMEKELSEGRKGKVSEKKG